MRSLARPEPVRRQEAEDFFGKPYNKITPADVADALAEMNAKLDQIVENVVCVHETLHVPEDNVTDGLLEAE